MNPTSPRLRPIRAMLLALGLSMALSALPVDGSTRFQFLRDGEFHGVSVSQLPAIMERSGITLSAHAAFGPVDFADYLRTEVEPARFINSTDGWGMGIDSGSISNAAFASAFGNDLGSESLVFNFLQSVTLSFDRTLYITELGFGDLEQHEKFILSVEGGPTVEIHGTAAWTAGNRGTSSWSGAQLGALEGYRLERGTRFTLTFDTVDPLDRVPDGTGNNLSASPSAGFRWVDVAFPQAFELGRPFVVAGGAPEATVGVELWGEAGNLTLRWTDDPDAGWPNAIVLGQRTPGLIEDGFLSGLSENTVWYFRFEADNGSEVIQSPVATFAWATDLYVSPEGDDSADGLSPPSALQTIDEALRRVRAMARRPQPEGPVIPNFYGNAESPHGQEIEDHLAALVDPVTIHLMPGYHYLENTIVIDKTTDGNLHFRGLWAEGGEAALRARLEIHGEDPRWMDPPATHLPVVSGGRPVTDWSPTTVNGVAAWVAELPEVAAGTWVFDQLFVNGRRAERSRWPKKGWFRMEAVDNSTRLDFRVSERDAREIDIPNFRNFNDVQVVALHRWVETRMRLGSYNSETRWINLLPPPPDPTFTLDGSHPVHGAGFAAYYFDNLYETLSEPGEWYLDRSTGRLYYIPLPGETMADTHVVAPRLRELFYVAGKAAGLGELNERLWHVTFSRIAFLHTRVDELSIHTGTGNSPVNSGRGALHFRFARAPVVEACLFGHVGEFGIEIGPESAGGRIGANLFRSMAFGGIKVWQASQATGIVDRTGWLHLHDNDIKGYGLYWHGGVGLLAGETVFTTIEHNHVRDGAYTAIRAAGGNSLARFGFSNRVRKNLAHNAGQGVLSDLAGLYVPGKSPHSVVEGNVVFNIHARDYQSQTVYLDGQAEFWTVRNNWLFGTNERNITIKGWTHDIYNNVIAFNTGDGLIDRRNGDEFSANSQQFPLIPRRAPNVRGNILLQAGNGYAYQNLFYNDVIQPWAVLEDNVHWNQTGPVWMRANGATLAEFQAAENKELTSIVADPRLVNPQRGDFRVHPDSPAVTQFGFTPFDNRDAGIRPAVWEAAGAVLFSVPSAPVPEWLPSDVPGLDGWYDAADLAADGPLHQWNSKTPFSYILRQFDTDLQPVVRTNARNGLPVVEFDGTAWMGNHEYAWRTRQHAGRFFDREFTIFMAHRPVSGVALAKGNTGGGGQWTIGEQPNAFQWAPGENVGHGGADFAVRAWRRTAAAWEFYENGVLTDSTTENTGHSFTSDAILYMGRRGGAGGFFEGEVAEVLIYMGRVEDDDVARIQAYLMEKWLEPVSDATFFREELIAENTAAAGQPYLRTLIAHLDEGVEAEDLVFSKVSGPAWLTVAPDGTLGGTPPETGPASFTVRATDATGAMHVVTVEIEVAEPSTTPSTPLGEVRILRAGEVLRLTWNPSADADFSHFIIFRSVGSLDAFEPIAAPVWSPVFEVPAPADGSVFFSIQPVNTSGL